MKETINTDIAIVGGGASGIMSAIAAAKSLNSQNKPVNIIIIEQSSRIGKKILMTGNGKCNLTNENIDSKHYNYNIRNYIEPILQEFKSDFIIKFFKSIGLIIKYDNHGRAYPYCEQASVVLDILRKQLDIQGVKILCDTNIHFIEKRKDNFFIDCYDKIIKSKRLIMACGGKSSPTLSLCTDAYRFLTRFGHTVTNTFPSLVPIATNMGFEKSLKGIRATANVTLTADNNIVKTEFGEVQFTETGLSGICIFNLSRLVGEFLNFSTVNGKHTKNISIMLDLMPEFSLEEIKELLYQRIKTPSQDSNGNLFLGVINKRLFRAILKSCNINAEGKCDRLTRSQILKIASTIKNWAFIPISCLDFKHSQVTCGGIDLHEFYNKTLESKLIKGLYCAGEFLNVDGDCGGFNLHWAWISGYIAGESASYF